MEKDDFDWGQLPYEWWIETGKTVGADIRHCKFAAVKLRNGTNTEAARLAGFGGGTEGSTRSHSILRSVKHRILKEAASIKPPYDPDLSADHFAVAQAVREANHGDIPDPPVNFGKMTDKEFKEYTRIHYGF